MFVRQQSALYLPEERAAAEKDLAELVKARIKLCQALNSAYHDDSKRCVRMPCVQHRLPITRLCRKLSHRNIPTLIFELRELEGILQRKLKVSGACACPAVRG